jgi:hypothetical protein
MGNPAIEKGEAGITCLVSLQGLKQTGLINVFATDNTSRHETK